MTLLLAQCTQYFGQSHEKSKTRPYAKSHLSWECFISVNIVAQVIVVVVQPIYVSVSCVANVLVNFQVTRSRATVKSDGYNVFLVRLRQTVRH